MSSYLFAIPPKRFVKETLALQELPDHGLTRRQISILTGKYVKYIKAVYMIYSIAFTFKMKFTISTHVPPTGMNCPFFT